MIKAVVVNSLQPSPSVLCGDGGEFQSIGRGMLLIYLVYTSFE